MLSLTDIKLKMKKLFYLTLGAGLLLASCAKEDSADVNQDKIYTEYELFYNQNQDKTHALAQFHFGGPTGTLLELDSAGANVTFNGTTMPYSAVWGAHHLEFAGNITSGTFSYTNSNGTVYTNSLPATGAESINYPIGFDTIVKSQAETFAWAGTALAANQHINMFVGSWTWGNDALLYTDALGATDFVMGVQAKANLAEGTSTVYMDRVLRVNADQAPPTHGGLIRYRYRPINVQVEVVP